MLCAAKVNSKRCKMSLNSTPGQSLKLYVDINKEQKGNGYVCLLVAEN